MEPVKACLRESSNVTGGPAPFETRDRFLQKLDDLIQAIRKTGR